MWGVPMLDMTPSAVEYLSLLLEQVEAEGSQSLRLVSERNGTLGLALEDLGDLQEGDELLGDEDRTVLVVDPTLAIMLAGATLDCVSTAEGERLVLVAT